jgi:hypothetical protein
MIPKVSIFAAAAVNFKANEVRKVVKIMVGKQHYAHYIGVHVSALLRLKPSLFHI